MSTPGDQHRGTLRDRTRGCLLAGAVGDALGGPVEFLSGEAIRRSFPEGVDLAHPGLITDDTQMTLFTADGLIRAVLAGEPRGGLGRSPQLWQAYRRWLLTQQTTSAPQGHDHQIGRVASADWLLSHPQLWEARAPGATCLSALRGERAGHIERPVNHSKGCGGVMRAAPAGFLPDAEEAYRAGGDLAALTHGHPSGWVAAGGLALLVHLLAARHEPLEEAVRQMSAALAAEPSGGEVVDALEGAVRAAEHAPADPATLAGLGAGWVAEEALAIAVYAALSCPDDMVAALRLAVEHGGDSDSTGAITGNILGAAGGVAALPADWLARVELADVITAVADDLAAACGGDLAGLADRHPPT